MIQKILLLTSLLASSALGFSPLAQNNGAVRSSLKVGGCRCFSGTVAGGLEFDACNAQFFFQFAYQFQLHEIFDSLLVYIA